tara:strand:- start:330 stop:2165 length:1836 start_codon:yes stop_codon:yes gene_type:complete
MSILTFTAASVDRVNNVTVADGDVMDTELARLYTNDAALETAIKFQHTDAGQHEFSDTEALDDTSGNELILFSVTASAVNEIEVTNAATSNHPQIAATGDDANINLKLTGKGSGVVQVLGDLQVDGTTTTINSTTLDVDDANITVNKGSNDAASEGAGITVDRTSTNGSIIYKDASASKFAIGAEGAEINVADISSTQTLTNKTLSTGTTIGDGVTINAQDDAFTIDDATDATIQILFNAAGTASTTTTLTSSQTSSRVITLPDATDTLVGKATTDTLTNKTLSTGTTVADGVTINAQDDAFAVQDAADATLQILFDAAGTTSTSTTLTSSQTSNRVITFPDATDTLVGKATTDTLTNKTIDADGTGNTITNIGSSEIKSEMITGQTEDVIVAGDSILFSDASDSGNLNRDTVQGILDLVPAPDFSDGGESGGAARTLGQTDAYDFALKTNNVEQLQIEGNHASAKGAITMPNQSAVYAYSSSEQTGVVTTTQTQVVMGAVLYDTLSEYNTSTNVFTAKVAGKYLVICAGGTNATFAGVNIFYLMKNDSTYASWSVDMDYSALPAAPPNFSTVVELAADDTLDWDIYHNQGTNQTLWTGAANCYMIIHKIA